MQKSPIMYHRFIVVLYFSCLFFHGAFAQSDYIGECRQKLQNAAAYTLEIAELMPDSLYSFRPIAAEMSFQEQLLHILSNLNWLSSSYLGGTPSTRDFKSEAYSKTEILAIMQETFDLVDAALAQLPPEQLSDTVSFFAGPMTKRQILTLLNDHHTHHRGQLIVYLRLNGLKPPRYRGW